MKKKGCLRIERSFYKVLTKLAVFSSLKNENNQNSAVLAKKLSTSN